MIVMLCPEGQNEIASLGGKACCPRNGLGILTQDLQPIAKVIGMAHGWGDAKRGADKGGGQFGNELLAAIIYRSEFGGEIAVKPAFVACPVTESMEGGAVIIDLIGVRNLMRNADEIFTRHIEGLMLEM